MDPTMKFVDRIATGAAMQAPARINGDFRGRTAGFLAKV
jgi:hypothetical protein